MSWAAIAERKRDGYRAWFAISGEYQNITKAASTLCSQKLENVAPGVWENALLRVVVVPHTREEDHIKDLPSINGMNDPEWTWQALEGFK
jgi:hypothetical protein